MSLQEIHVATSTLKEHRANKVATINDVATINPSSCKESGRNRSNKVAIEQEQTREIHVATSTRGRDIGQ